MRALTAAVFDVRFQFRHGFYYAYLVVCILYILIIRSLTGEAASIVATLLIFSDTSVLGFFFVGGVILLEKDQRTLETLFVSPLRIYEFIIAKILSLAVLSVVMSLVIMVFSIGTSFKPVLFLAGVLLSSAFFTLLGITFSAYSRSINVYLFKSSFGIMLIFLPMLGYFKLFETPFFYLFPTKASLILIESAFKSFQPMELVYAVACLLLWIAAIGIIAHNSFYKNIIMKIGES